MSNESLREALEIGLRCAHKHRKDLMLAGVLFNDIRRWHGAMEDVRKIEAAIAALDQSGESTEMVDTPWGDQDLAKTGGAVAWHLIERHADNWRETGDMMEAWARAWYPANVQAQGDAWPAAPEGWKMVPIQPTSSMVVDGFEAVSEFRDSDEYEEMSGCQGSAEAARICYRTMLAAAPTLAKDKS